MIRKRLDASGDLFEVVWLKPKGMHQKTFDRHRKAEGEANGTAMDVMCRKLGISRVGR